MRASHACIDLHMHVQARSKSEWLGSQHRGVVVYVYVHAHTSYTRTYNEDMRKALVQVFSPLLQLLYVMKPMAYHDDVVGEV